MLAVEIGVAALGPVAAVPLFGFRCQHCGWFATGVALVLMILLIVFIVQNSTKVEVHFVGMSGSISLGMALLIAAVGGGVVVAVAGVARVTQLRMAARHTRQSASGP